jgi:hypothetical protein
LLLLAGCILHVAQTLGVGTSSLGISGGEAGGEEGVFLGRTGHINDYGYKNDLRFQLTRLLFKELSNICFSVN